MTNFFLLTLLISSLGMAQDSDLSCQDSVAQFFIESEQEIFKDDILNIVDENLQCAYCSDENFYPYFIEKYERTFRSYGGPLFPPVQKTALLSSIYEDRIGVNRSTLNSAASISEFDSIYYEESLDESFLTTLDWPAGGGSKYTKYKLHSNGYVFFKHWYDHSDMPTFGYCY